MQPSGTGCPWGFVGCVWPQNPLVLPPLHPQTSAPRFLTLLQACWCLILHHFLRCLSLAISGLFFGMGAAMCSRILDHGWAERGAWGCGFHLQFLFLFRAGETLQTWLQKGPVPLPAEPLTGHCLLSLFFFFWRGESPLGYSLTFPPNFPPMRPFLGEGSASSSLPVTKNFGRRCLGPAPSSNCPRDFKPLIYFLTPGSRRGPHSLWACLLCSQGLALPFWLWWGWLGGSGVLRVSPWDPA